MSWRWGQTAILTPSSSDHSSTSFSSCLGLLNCGSLRAASPQSASWFSRWHPISNWLKPSVPWLYYCLTPICFRCSSIYLHRCISWLSAQSRVNIYKTLWDTKSKSSTCLDTSQSTDNRCTCEGIEWYPIDWKQSLQKMRLSSDSG